MNGMRENPDRAGDKSYAWGGCTEYKVAARLLALSELPSDRHPDHSERAAVLGVVKVWSGHGSAWGKVGATANLDNPCARQRPVNVGRGEETASDRTKKLE
jgi:hypothetical protein